MTGSCLGYQGLGADGAGGAWKGFMLREPLSLPTQDAVPEDTGQGPLCTLRAILPVHWHWMLVQDCPRSCQCQEMKC